MSDLIVATTPLPKVMSACLDLLPYRRHWDESEFNEWLEMFEGACRIWYRLPSAKARPAPSEDAARERRYGCR